MLLSLPDSADFEPLGIAMVEPKRPALRNGDASAGSSAAFFVAKVFCRRLPA